MTELLDVLYMLIMVAGILGISLLAKSTLRMAIEMIVKDFIDREKNLKATIYEVQAVERAGSGREWSNPPENDYLVELINNKMDELRSENAEHLTQLTEFTNDFKIVIMSKIDEMRILFNVTRPVT